MSITPLPPVGPPAPPPPSPGPTTFTPSSIVDGQSSYSADIAAGNQLTVQAFSDIILSTANESNKIAWEIQQHNANSQKSFYEASITELLGILDLYGQITEVSEEYVALYNDNVSYLETVNDQLDLLNSQVLNAENAVTTLNFAIFRYNFGLITAAQLNDLIDNYNSFATSYNTTVSETNDAIDVFNETTITTNEEIVILNQNLTTITNFFRGQETITSSASEMPTVANLPSGATPPTPFVSFNPSPITPKDNTMRPQGKSSAALANQLFASLNTLSLTQFALTISILQMHSAYSSFVQFFLQGRAPFLPPAFYTPSPDLFLNGTGSTGGAGSGVSLGALIATLSNPLVSAIIGQGIFISNMNLLSLPVTSRVTNELTLFNLQMLSQIGLLAGSSALRLLGGKLPSIDLNSSQVAAALGLALTSEIALAIESGLVLSGIREILTRAYPELSANQLEALTTQLASSVEIFMLQLGVLQLALSLKSPSLFGQFLGTLTSAKALNLLDPTTNPNTFEGKSFDDLKDALSKNLANQANLSIDQARDVINQSVISAEIFTQFNQDSLVNHLIQLEINNQAALNTVIYAQAYIQAEIIGGEVLNHSLSAEITSRPILSNELVEQIISSQPNLTNRELRDQLAEQFFINGSTREEALLAATLAVVGPGISPISLETFRNQLNQTATNQLNELGNPSEVQNIVNQLISTVIGANIPGSQTSVHALLDSRLQTLIQLQDAAIIEQLNATTRTFLEPTVELYVFAERLRDPANTFLFCAQTGIMYGQQHLPSNYLKNVDIMG